MLLTLTTTHEPATDLGYLLVKHPDRVHRFEVPTGTAYVCFPEATPQRCTAALILDTDPARLATGQAVGRRRAPEAFALGRHVNDRPYAASSLLAAALNRVFRSAMRGTCDERPELAARAVPLRLHIPVLRCRGGPELATAMFAPLDWEVTATPVALDETHPEWGPSSYLDLVLAGTVRLADALNHLYVLLPVLDDAKHYWVAPDEVEKLVRAGGGWLGDHPERGRITRRYLVHRRALVDEAHERIQALARVEDGAEPDSVQAEDDQTAPALADEEAQLPESVRRAPLARQRREAVLGALAAAGATRVLDLGCGAGALIADMMAVPAITEIVGVDISAQVLQLAQRRLRLDRVAEHRRGRVRLWQSALTYTDDRLGGYDAAVLMEVIEHVDEERLDALAAAVFGHARPSTVIVTTPNVEYNARYLGMAGGSLRHRDHRFEWTRVQFATWSAAVGDRYRYRVEVRGVGEADSELGCPTQLAVFTRAAAEHEQGGGDDEGRS